MSDEIESVGDFQVRMYNASVSSDVSWPARLIRARDAAVRRKALIEAAEMADVRGDRALADAIRARTQGPTE